MATKAQRPRRPKMEIDHWYRISFSDDDWTTVVHTSVLLVDNARQRTPAAVNAWISRWLRHHPDRQVKIEEVF